MNSTGLDHANSAVQIEGFIVGVETGDHPKHPNHQS